MKSRPKSLNEFLKVVALVEHPKLKPHHRLLLQTMATFASYTTGRDVYPGRDYLTRAVGRSWDRVNEYAKQCEDMGLIRRVGGGHKGRNTEWEFCLDNPAYKDRDEGQHHSADLTYADLSTHRAAVLHNARSAKSKPKAAIGPQRSADPPNPTPTPSPTPTAKAEEGGEVDTKTPEHIAEKPGRQHVAPDPAAALLEQEAKELKRWMQQSYAQKHEDKLNAQPKDWDDLFELLKDYGPRVVSPRAGITTSTCSSHVHRNTNYESTEHQRPG